MVRFDLSVLIKGGVQGCVCVCVRRRVPGSFPHPSAVPGSEKLKYEIFSKALNGRVCRAAGRPACLPFRGDGGH